MREFDSPTYVLDFRDKNVCEKIENAVLDVQINIQVRNEQKDRVASLPAIGKKILDEDNNELFEVRVITEAGEQTFTWTYSFLVDAVKMNCERS